MWWILLGCLSNPAKQALEEGVWTLSGDQLYGFVRVGSSSCDMELWGDGFHTADGTTPCLTSREEAGKTGVSFALDMGAGGAQAYGEFSPDMTEMRVPLGSREGDFEAILEVQASVPDPLELAAARELSEQTLSVSQGMWSASVFRLMQDGRLVGELFLPDEGLSQIQLYAPEWMTPSRVPVSLVEKGPDLWISFEVMPSLEGELGLLIVNRPSNGVVFPISDRPLPGEIRLELTGGKVNESERSALIDRALDIAVEREIRLARPKVEQAHTLLESKGCPPWEDVAPSLSKQMLYGYKLASSKTGEGCRLAVEPTSVQHGRRVSFRMESGGEVHHVIRSIFLE